MAKGRILVGNLFGPPEVIEPDEPKKGRSAELNAARNRRLLHRLVYYKRDERNAYEWIIKRIGQEFELTEVTVGEIIADNIADLKWIKTGFDIKTVKKEYFWMDWNI